MCQQASVKTARSDPIGLSFSTSLAQLAKLTMSGTAPMRCSSQPQRQDQRCSLGNSPNGRFTVRGILVVKTFVSIKEDCPQYGLPTQAGIQCHGARSVMMGSYFQVTAVVDGFLASAAS